MKLAYANSAAEMNGVSQTTEFTISMKGGKAFRVLSDSLYSNKIGSLVREVCSNAADSHIAAQRRDVPFIVHIPSGLEPWFSVRDFGTGISPANMVNVFCRYFESTKDGSNDEVGGFGLGSKTPYSYTDQFTITSIFEGIERTYSAFIGEGGMPSLALLSENETTEHNGVEINVNVKSDDFNRFSKEVAEQLKFFKVKPEIHNAYDFKFNPIPTDSIFESSYLSLFNSNYSVGTNSYAIQGQVGYVIDHNQVKAKLSDRGRKDLVEFYTSLSRWVFLLHFPIGDVGVTASRESMEYTNHTIDSFIKLLDLAKADIATFVSNELVNAKTVHDRIAFINKSEFLRSFIDFKQVNVGTAKAMGGRYGFNLQDFTVHMVPDPKDATKQVQSSRFELQSCTSGNIRIRDKSTTVQLFPDLNDTLFIFRDSASKPLIRIDYFMQSYPNCRVISLTPTNGYTVSDADIKELRKFLGGFDGQIVKLSDLPDAPKVVDPNAAPRKKYNRFFGYTWTNGATNTRDCDKLDAPVNESAKDGGVYICVNNSTVIPDDADVQFYRAMIKATAYSWFTDVIPDLPELYIFRENDMGDVKGNANFKTLSQYVTESKAALKDMQYLMDRVTAHYTRRGYNEGAIKQVSSFIRDVGSYGLTLDDSAWQAEIANIETVIAKPVTLNNIEEFFIAKCITLDSGNIEQIAKDTAKKLYSKYSIIRNYSSYGTDKETVSEFVNYLNYKFANT